MLIVRGKLTIRELSNNLSHPITARSKSKDAAISLLKQCSPFCSGKVRQIWLGMLFSRRRRRRRRRQAGRQAGRQHTFTSLFICCALVCGFLFNSGKCHADHSRADSTLTNQQRERERERERERKKTNKHHYRNASALLFSFFGRHFSLSLFLSGDGGGA